MVDESRESSLLKQLRAAKKEKKEMLIQQFSQLYEVDVESIRDRKHPSRLCCPDCHQSGSIGTYGYADSEKKRRRFHCKACGRHFNDATGTLFHNRKLRNHLLPFLVLMLNDTPIRKIASLLAVSPTTIHKWRHLVLQYIERHMSSIVNEINHPDIIKETSIREINPSCKGLHGSKEIVVCTFSIKFEYNRLGNFHITVLPSNSLKPPRFLIRNERSIRLNAEQTSSVGLSAAELHLLHHSKNAQKFQADFDIKYYRMRGVAQPYLNQYLQWHCYLQRINSLTNREKVRSLILACL